MRVRNLAQLGPGHGAALVDSDRAARMKRASDRRIERARDLALDLVRAVLRPVWLFNQAAARRAVLVSAKIVRRRSRY